MNHRTPHQTRDWFPFPDFQGTHASLRKLTCDDRDELVTSLHDLRDQSTTVVPSDANFDAWFANLLREEEAGRNWSYAIRSAEGRIVGTTSYLRISETHRRLEIGRTVVSPTAQRTGVNSEAKLHLLGHAFEKLGCNVVQLRTDWLNHQSRTAIERLGAKLDGVLRGHLIMPDGHIRDSAVYSITASEWPGVKIKLATALGASRPSTRDRVR